MRGQILSGGGVIPAATSSDDKHAIPMVVKNGIRFIISSYDADLTMDATGEALALATGVKLGAGAVQIANRGATTEGIRVAFGTSESDALSNLNMTGNAATTGYYMPAAADGGSQSVVVLGVPALATHVAAGPATAGDTQSVSVSQGI
jgi:hypothetical protein